MKTIYRLLSVVALVGTLSVTFLTWQRYTILQADPADRQTFTPHIIADDFDGAYSVYAADLDSDGDVDIVAGASNAGELAWWENDAGSFQRHTLPGDCLGAASVYAADLDSDGDTDLLCAAYSANEISWWENDGSQAFTKRTVANDFNGASAIQAIDLDSDGDQDLVGAAALSDQIAWWENDGAQTFTPHIVDDNFDGTRSVYAVDLDSDGDTDLIGAAVGANTVAWWENDGTQAFTKHLMETNFWYAWDVYAADLDADGDVDIVGTAIYDDYIQWWENNGVQTFTTHIISSDFADPRSVHVADINDDGALDVLVASSGADHISWWKNDGAGNFIGYAFDYTLDGAWSVYAADVNGDGAMDILGSGVEADQVVWWEQDPPTPVIAATFPFYDGFEPLTGTLAALPYRPGWMAETTYEGRVRFDNAVAYSGTHSLILDDFVQYSATSRAAAILTVDLSGQSQVDLNFWMREFYDENHDDDGIFISDDDGATWYKVYSFNNSSNYWRQVFIDLDEEAAKNGMIMNSLFQVKFQFYDNSPITGSDSDGYAIDEVKVYIADDESPTIETPTYASEVSSNKSLTVTARISDTNTGDSGIAGANLVYGYTSPYNYRTVSGTGPGGNGDGLWTFVIPAQGEYREDETLYFSITACDSGGASDCTINDNNQAYYPLQIAVNQPPLTPTNLSPPAGTFNQPLTNTTLVWTSSDPEDDPLTYRVYFDDDTYINTVAYNITETVYNPGPLLPDTTYYWQIKADDGQKFTYSPVWTFTTVSRPSAGFPFEDSFETGMFQTGWYTYATNDGRIQFSSAYTYDGNNSIVLDDADNDSYRSYAALILDVNLSGQSDLWLDFWWLNIDIDSSYNNGLYMSDNSGNTWAKILTPGSSMIWNHEVLDLIQITSAHSLSLNDQFQIKFQFYGDDPVPYDGLAIDKIQVRTGNWAYLPLALKNYPEPTPTPTPVPTPFSTATPVGTCTPSPPGDSDNIADALTTCSGHTVTGQVSQSDRDDVYQVYIPDYSLIKITMTGSGSGDADLYLFAPDATDVNVDPWAAASINMGNEEEIGGYVYTGGVWYINIFAFEGSTDYQVKVKISDDKNRGVKTVILVPLPNTPQIYDRQDVEK